MTNVLEDLQRRCRAQGVIMFYGSQRKFQPRSDVKYEVWGNCFLGKLFPKAGCYSRQQRHWGMTREISRNQIHILGRLEICTDITTLFEKRDIKVFCFLFLMIGPFHIQERALKLKLALASWVLHSYLIFLMSISFLRPVCWAKQTEGKSVSITYYLYDIRQITSFSEHQFL